MFVLSAEGGRYIPSGKLNAVHKVLGVFNTEPEALAAIPKDRYEDEEVYILTDMTTKKASRV